MGACCGSGGGTIEKPGAVKSSAMKPGLPELGYWNIRGLGQGIRFQLIYQGVEFNDNKYKYLEGENFRGEWLKEKYNLGLEFPNLPYFVDGNLKMTQSMAIHQYIADKWDPTLLGNNPKERAKVMMLGNILGDLKKAVTEPHYTSGSKEESLRKVPTNLPPILKFMGKNKFLCTNEKPTWVDFYFFELVNTMRWVSNDEIFNDYPTLKYYYDEMSNLANLKEHLIAPNASEKKLVFNGKSALLNGTQTW